MIDSSPRVELLKKEHGPLWWLFYNIFNNLIRKPVQKHPRVSKIVFGCLLVLAFILRTFLHPLAYYVRIHTPDIIGLAAIVACLWLLKRKFHRSHIKRRKYWAIAGAVVLVIGILVSLGLTPHAYLSLYFKHQNLNVTELKELPLTGHERIQPHHSISVLADEAMSEVEKPASPDFVRIGKDYFFTMAIEPTYTLPRLFGTVKEVFVLPGDVASPDFSKANRKPVQFAVSENMLFGKNSATTAIRSFGLTRFWSYKPGDVKYAQNDQGKLVQVVSLTKLSGVMFPKPEFGGVLVIPQHSGGVLHAGLRLFFGEGEWIRPEDIGKHAYLKGQNIVPIEVSRYIAESFRFQMGIAAPFPGWHRGDIRIPDLVGDSNNQPFTIYAEFGPEGSADNKLWHYFALEPYNDADGKRGLNTSVFIPADGIGPIKVYRHYKHDDALCGVSAVPSKVMESKKQYDWQQSHPAEQRPWIHIVGGKKRFFWLTTVITYTNKDSREGDDYIAGAVPEVVLTDALYKYPVWVRATDPQGWAKELEGNADLNKMWGWKPPPLP